MNIMDLEPGQAGITHRFNKELSGIIYQLKLGFNKILYETSFQGMIKISFKLKING